MGLLLAVYGFVVVVDPWGMLPLSPPWSRAVISTNARFSFPALARDPAFDSALIGTSTTRLLQPDVLDATIGGHFVNLAMNAATAWEQAQMLALFTRTHPAARTLILGLDSSWCTLSPERGTGRPFPEWMYVGSPWRGYREMATLYAVQEAANQFAVLVGWKRERYGRDGYTTFLPPDRLYDPARVAATFAQWGPAPATPAAPGVQYRLPALDLLSERLAALPPDTRAVLFFTPNHISEHGVPGSAAAGLWQACKQQVAQIAGGRPGTTVVDFMIDSAVTRDMGHYWDPLHYRAPVAAWLMQQLAAAASGRPVVDGVVLQGGQQGPRR